MVNNYVGTYISTSKTTKATPLDTLNIRRSSGKQPRRWSLPETRRSKIEVVSSSFSSNQKVRSKSQPRAKIQHQNVAKTVPKYEPRPSTSTKTKETKNGDRTNSSPIGSPDPQENREERKSRKTWQLHRQTSDLLPDLIENDHWTRTTTKIVVTQRISKFDFL